MANIDLQFHGSDIEKVEALYHIKKSEILNFSGNVNPLGLSKMVIEELKNHIDLIATYPDRDYAALRGVISLYTQVHPDQVLVGNGSTELISLFIKVINPTCAMIIGPTYSEYEREIRIGGGKCNYYALKESLDFKLDLDGLLQTMTSDTDLLVLCNPNNPTSTALKHQELRTILDYCLSHHIFVLIDETYVEFATDMDYITGTSFTEIYPNLFIIRGVSKFFASPGLRLGYGITGNKDIIRDINRLKNPWTINSLASYAGELMLQDQGYINASIKLIEVERKRILDILNRMPAIKVYEPSANFMLVKLLDPTKKSSELFEYLIQKKIMIRDASGFPFLDHRFFRFCINMPKDNDLLLLNLKEFLK